MDTIRIRQAKDADREIESTVTARSPHRRAGLTPASAGMRMGGAIHDRIPHLKAFSPGVNDLLTLAPLRTALALLVTRLRR